MLSNLTLEEIIAIKLELSSRTLRSPLFGLPIWEHLHEIVQDAVLKFAVSTTQTTSEAARFLGMSQGNLYILAKKYQIWNYFDPSKGPFYKNRLEEVKKETENDNGPVS